MDKVIRFGSSHHAHAVAFDAAIHDKPAVTTFDVKRHGYFAVAGPDSIVWLLGPMDAIR